MGSEACPDPEGLVWRRVFKWVSIQNEGSEEQGSSYLWVLEDVNLCFLQGKGPGDKTAAKNRSPVAGGIQGSLKLLRIIRFKSHGLP